MKFRNPETGEVYDVLDSCVKSGFCKKYDNCLICPIYKCEDKKTCAGWVKNHPHEAASLMGYEVIEAPIYIPYICMRLDVKPDQPFCIDGYDKHVCFRIQSDGTFCTTPPMQKGSAAALLHAIEHPERVMPFWSKQEIADAQTLLRMFPTSHVEITHNTSGTIVTCRNLMHGEIQRILLGDLFPSLQLGQTVDASDIAARGQ